MLEQLVRPFQTPISIATIRVVAKDLSTPKSDAIIQWGQAGTLPSPTEETKTPTGGISWKVDECSANLNEHSRKTDNVRVENPDDPSQYVVVQRINSISFDKKGSKIVGAIRTETTVFAADDPFAGTPFGDVPKADNCQDTYNLNNT